MTRVYVSILPLLYGGGDENTVLQLTVTKTNKHTNLPPNLWDVHQFEVLTNDKDDAHTERSKGQETALWNLELDSKHYYHIVPNAMKRGMECKMMMMMLIMMIMMLMVVIMMMMIIMVIIMMMMMMILPRS